MVCATGLKRVCGLIPTAGTLRGDKVRMLSYTWPHKPQRKMKVSICNHYVDGLMSALVICERRVWSYMIPSMATETRYHYITQTQTPTAGHRKHFIT